MAIVMLHADARGVLIVVQHHIFMILIKAARPCRYSSFWMMRAHQDPFGSPILIPNRYQNSWNPPLSCSTFLGYLSHVACEDFVYIFCLVGWPVSPTTMSFLFLLLWMYITTSHHTRSTVESVLQIPSFREVQIELHLVGFLGYRPHTVEYPPHWSYAGTITPDFLKVTQDLVVSSDLGIFRLVK